MLHPVSGHGVRCVSALACVGPKTFTPSTSRCCLAEVPKNSGLGSSCFSAAVSELSGPARLPSRCRVGGLAAPSGGSRPVPTEVGLSGAAGLPPALPEESRWLPVVGSRPSPRALEEVRPRQLSCSAHTLRSVPLVDSLAQVGTLKRFLLSPEGGLDRSVSSGRFAAALCLPSCLHPDLLPACRCARSTVSGVSVRLPRRVLAPLLPVVSPSPMTPAWCCPPGRNLGCRLLLGCAIAIVPALAASFGPKTDPRSGRAACGLSPFTAGVASLVRSTGFPPDRLGPVPRPCARPDALCLPPSPALCSAHPFRRRRGRATCSMSPIGAALPGFPGASVPAPASFTRYRSTWRVQREGMS